MLRLVIMLGALCLGGCSSCGGDSGATTRDEPASSVSAASADPSFHKLLHARRHFAMDGGPAPLLAAPSASAH